MICAADLVITANNLPQPIIGKDCVGDRPQIICDASTPSDVEPAVKALPSVIVIHVG